MQRLLRYARWDADAIRDDSRAYAVDHLGADGAVLRGRDRLCEAGTLLCGRATALHRHRGMHRELPGEVFLVLATSRGRPLTD